MVRCLKVGDPHLPASCPLFITVSFPGRLFARGIFGKYCMKGAEREEARSADNTLEKSVSPFVFVPFCRGISSPTLLGSPVRV